MLFYSSTYLYVKIAILSIDEGMKIWNVAILMKVKCVLKECQALRNFIAILLRRQEKKISKQRAQFRTPAGLIKYKKEYSHYFMSYLLFEEKAIFRQNHLFMLTFDWWLSKLSGFHCFLLLELLLPFVSSTYYLIICII